jgi:hypothetical protein
LRLAVVHRNNFPFRVHLRIHTTLSCQLRLLLLARRLQAVTKLRLAVVSIVTVTGATMRSHLRRRW